MAGFLRLLYQSLSGLSRFTLFRAALHNILRSVTVTEVIREGAVAEGQVYAPQTAITSRTQEWGEPLQEPWPEQFPSVGWRVFDDAIAVTTRHFSYLVHGNQMMIGNRRNPGPWEVVRRFNRVVWQDGHRALVDLVRGPTLRIERGILLGGRDFTNWYHWLVDGLPQLHTAHSLPEEYRDWPVLVPEQIFRFPTMVEALNLLLGERPAIRVPEWARIRGTLCWIDSLEILNVPRSQVVSGDEAEVHLLHREGMERYRNVFLEALGTSPAMFGEKIALIRKGGRRLYNQDEVVEVALAAGFQPVAPETLTLREQVNLFHHATHLIGPSGAGFAGILFCQPATQILCWQDTRIRFMTILPDLAELARSHYWHIFYEAMPGDIYTSAYRLDPDWLRGKLTSFLAQDV